MREVIFLSLTSSSTCNYVIVRVFPLGLGLNWLVTVDIQGFSFQCLCEQDRAGVGYLGCILVAGSVVSSGNPSSEMGHCPSLLSYILPQGIWGPETTDLSANQGSIHGIRGQWWFVPAVTTVYLLHCWTRNKLCFVYKIKTHICSIFWKYSIISVNNACKICWNCIWKTWSPP